MSLLLLIWAWVGAVWALDGSDALRLTLDGGVVVEGRFARAGAASVFLNASEQGLAEVPLVLINAVAVNGQPMSLPVFEAELAESWRASMLIDGERIGPAPPPAVVAGASMVWAGAGHAALGEWKSFGLYSGVEVALLGLAALNLTQEDLRPLPALLALDVLFKIYAAQESARIAKRRRAAGATKARRRAIP